MPIIKDLAQQGNKLIFTTSFGYMDQTLEVAKAVPGREVRALHRLQAAPTTSAPTTRASTRAARCSARSPA